MSREKLLALLSLVPQPHVQLAAAALRVVLAEARRQPPEADLDAAVDAAVEAALAQWRGIADVAQRELGGDA